MAAGYPRAPAAVPAAGPGAEDPAADQYRAGCRAAPWRRAGPGDPGADADPDRRQPAASGVRRLHGLRPLRRHGRARHPRFARGTLRQGHGPLRRLRRLHPHATRHALAAGPDAEHRRQPELPDARARKHEQRSLGGLGAAQTDPLRPALARGAPAGGLHRQPGAEEHRGRADSGAGRQVGAVLLVGPESARDLLHLRRQLDGRARVAPGPAVQRHLRAQFQPGDGQRLQRRRPERGRPGVPAAHPVRVGAAAVRRPAGGA
ncbi:hypothetical protein D9M71_579740 [compost metagenome]